MKKILYGLISIGVISTVAIFASNAYFNDLETSKGNVFEAGEIDLFVDSKCSYNGQPSSQCGTWDSKNLTTEKFFNFSDIKPGDYGENTISPKIEDNPSWLCMTISPTQNDDVSSTEPELQEFAETPDNVSDLWDGELRQSMAFHIWADICNILPAVPGDNIYQADCDKNITENITNKSVTLALVDTTNNVFTGISGQAINRSQKYYLGFGWSLPNNVGNIVQTDNFTTDISFRVEQARNNDKFICSPEKVNIFDDFNDGNADGWWLGYSLANPANNGNWRVESGELLQDTGFDGVIALIDNQQFSDQIVETKVKLNGPSGGGGIILWYQDDNNWTHAIVYPAAGFVEVSTHVNGSTFGFQYPYPSLANDTWYDLKVVADSSSGSLDVYLDGNYLFTHTMATPNRTGQSGVINGNAGGAFDDFKVNPN